MSSLAKYRNRESGRIETTALGLLVAAALILAFLTGRLTAGMRPFAPSDPQEADQEAGKLLAAGTADKQWTVEEDEAFTRAIAKLGQEGQLRHLRALAQKVNHEKVRILSDPAVTKDPCVRTCSPGQASGSAGDKGAASPPPAPPGRTPTGAPEKGKE